jgi:hypothetical protein
LQKEGTNLFEVAHQFADGALVPGGEKFEVGRLDSQPRIGWRAECGCGRGDAEYHQRQPPFHEDECITGGSYPRQASTGSRGYFGNEGSVRPSWHK